MLPRLAEFAGADAHKLLELIEALGSSCNHYLRAS
jgi:hypothetical protein